MVLTPKRITIFFLSLMVISLITSFSAVSIGVIEANTPRADTINQMRKCSVGLEGDGSPELPCHFPGNNIGMDSNCITYQKDQNNNNRWIEDLASIGTIIENGPSQRLICDGSTVQIQDDTLPSLPATENQEDENPDTDLHSSSPPPSSSSSSQTYAPSYSSTTLLPIDQAWLRFASLVNPQKADEVWIPGLGWKKASTLTPPPPTTFSSSTGSACFPLAQNSLARVSYNWGNRRESGARCHAGVDLITQGDGTVVAIDDGVITGIVRNFYACPGGQSSAILIYHPSLGKTANYAEINTADIYRFQVGMRISRGQSIGKATACGMLHFELYDGNVARNDHWRPTPPNTVSADPHDCANKYMDQKPQTLANPEILIHSLEGKYCTGTISTPQPSPNNPVPAGSLQGTPQITVSPSTETNSLNTAKTQWEGALANHNIAGKTWIGKLSANGANDNFNREDTGRNTIIFQPNPQVTGSPDLIYFFHGIHGFGMYGNNNDMLKRVVPQAKEIAERGGNIIIAFPELPWSVGTDGDKRSKGRQRTAWDGTDSNFYEFHNQILSTLQSQFGINQIGRIIIVGHSAGGAAVKFTAVDTGGRPKRDLQQVHPQIITCSDCDYSWGSPSVVRTIYEQYIQSNPNTHLYMMVQDPSRSSAHEPTQYSIALTQRIGGLRTQDWSYQQSPKTYNTPGATSGQIFDVTPQVHYVPLNLPHKTIGEKSIVYSYYPELIGTS